MSEVSLILRFWPLNKRDINARTQMQSHGAPPTEIMGDLPPGFSLPGLPGAGGEEGEGCCIM